MRTLTTLPILFFVISARLLFAQETVTGQVIDESDGSPIPYVTIGVSNSDMGTVSDAGGVFKLVLPKNLGRRDMAVIFSSVGYMDAEMDVSELTDNSEIKVRLKPRIHEIPEVSISSRPPKEVVYGNKGRARTTHFNFYNVREEFDDGLGRELGKVLKVAADIKLLELGFYISGSPFKRVKFRMNLYDMSGETPEKIQLAKDIVFDVDKQSGWFHVDLTAYEIYLKGYEKIGVTIQWLASEHDDSTAKYFSIPAGLIALTGGMFRSKSEARWDFPKINLSMYVKALRY